MFLDLILVLFCTVLITLLSGAGKNFGPFFKTEFIKRISQNLIICGGFISVLKFIVFICKIENMLKEEARGSEVSSFLDFTFMILVCFRPLLFGIAAKLILCPFVRKNEKPEKKFSEKTSEESESKEKYALLSRREKEVARLAAQGCSNAQIADELFISTETVKRHLSTVFEKSGIESRKQLDGKELE